MADFNGTAGDDLLKGTGGDDVMLGRLGDDTLQGLAGNDFLSGGGGDDLLNGGSGNDTLNGGAGTDQLLGGSGDDLIIVNTGTDGPPFNDVIDGGSGFDTVSFAGLKQGVVVVLTGADHTIDRVEAVIGTDFHDEIQGQQHVAGAYYGGAGDDSLVGGHFHDTLDGGTGDDVLQAYPHTLATGGDGDDFVLCNGQSTVDGGAGDDLLRIVQGGDNVLTGGEGADVFEFDSARNGDLIQDLTGQDTIDISHIDAVKQQGGDQAFVLVAALDGHAGEAALVYDAGADQTRLEMDTNGDGAADRTILISGDHTDFTNFVL